MTAAGLGSGQGRRWPAFVLFALLSLGWQSLIIQTHVHPGAARAIWSGAGVARIATPARTPADLPADCPSCRQAAQAGHYLDAGGILLTGPSGFAIVAPARLERPWRGRHRSPGWRSRGPPAGSSPLEPAP